MKQVMKSVFLVSFAVGCCVYAAHGDEHKINTVRDVLSSLKVELLSIEATYSELAEVKDIRIRETGLQYSHNCRFLGKRGYEDTGPNALAIGLRVMPIPQFRVDVERVAMQMPSYRWPSLGLVGWSTLHIGKNPSPGLSARLNEILNNHIEMIDKLNRIAVLSK